MSRFTVLMLSLLLPIVPAVAVTFEKCMQHDQQTCVVDGDTIRYHGERIRLEGFDTPELHTNICGGDFERELADQATNRLIELLNRYTWMIERTGVDRYDRTLAIITVGGGVNVGDILVSEGLARVWPDGNEWWCEER